MRTSVKWLAIFATFLITSFLWIGVLTVWKSQSYHARFNITQEPSAKYPGYTQVEDVSFNVVNNDSNGSPLREPIAWVEWRLKEPIPVDLQDPFTLEIHYCSLERTLGAVLVYVHSGYQTETNPPVPPRQAALLRLDEKRQAQRVDFVSVSYPKPNVVRLEFPQKLAADLKARLGIVRYTTDTLDTEAKRDAFAVFTLYPPIRLDKELTRIGVPSLPH